MSCASSSGSFDPVTPLVAHVPIKFIVGALAAFDDLEAGTFSKLGKNS
jgi:hypothetical protein